MKIKRNDKLILKSKFYSFEKYVNQIACLKRHIYEAFTRAIFFFLLKTTRIILPLFIISKNYRNVSVCTITQHLALHHPGLIYVLKISACNKILESFK